MGLAKIQSRQIMVFIELKKKIELGEQDEIKKLVRDMIEIGLELEAIQAKSKTRILLNPIDHYKRA